MPQRDLAVELLQKLMNNEIKARSNKNFVQSKLFSELVANAIRKYQSRAIEAAQVIEELIGLAKQIRESVARGETLPRDDEVAFYDDLETNDSAVKVLGDETLRAICRDFVETVRKNTTIDRIVPETVPCFRQTDLVDGDEAARGAMRPASQDKRQLRFYRSK